MGKLDEFYRKKRESVQDKQMAHANECRTRYTQTDTQQPPPPFSPSYQRGNFFTGSFLIKTSSRLIWLLEKLCINFCTHQYLHIHSLNLHRTLDTLQILTYHFGFQTRCWRLLKIRNRILSTFGFCEYVLDFVHTVCSNDEVLSISILVKDAI